jgi:type II secretory pathway component PulJ
LADVTQKLHQVAQGQERLEAQTSRMDGLHKIPELMQKLEHLVPGLERLNTPSSQRDTFHAREQLKGATIQSIRSSSPRSPLARVANHVQSAPSGDRTSHRARSRVTETCLRGATLVVGPAYIPSCDLRRACFALGLSHANASYEPREPFYLARAAP